MEITNIFDTFTQNYKLVKRRVCFLDDPLEIFESHHLN